MCEITALGDFQGLWEEGETGKLHLRSSTLSIRPAFPPLFGAAAKSVLDGFPALVRDGG